jgi:hypothetical protein
MPKGFAFMDNKQLVETEYQSIFEMFCKYPVFQQYILRARFVDPDKWNNSLGESETKEIEDGPVNKKEFYENNFFYVRSRDLNGCK